MKKQIKNKSGFTLVEIMIVVAIIALLAAIAIPNLLRARISANDALAQNNLRLMSQAAEEFANTNGGSYPTAVTDLTEATPPYLTQDLCGDLVSGFNLACTWATSGYTVTATPDAVGSTGSVGFSMTTGGILTEVEAEEVVEE